MVVTFSEQALCTVRNSVRVTKAKYMRRHLIYPISLVGLQSTSSMSSTSAVKFLAVDDLES